MVRVFGETVPGNMEPRKSLLVAVFHDTANGNFLMFLILALLTGLPGGAEGAGASFCSGLASDVLLECKHLFLFFWAGI